MERIDNVLDEMLNESLTLVTILLHYIYVCVNCILLHYICVYINVGGYSDKASSQCSIYRTVHRRWKGIYHIQYIIYKHI